ncbi:transglycosylase SLT domain-containing protein [Streptomyces pristinaespiralis]|uniref:transglycosylase SLT domain-containing protein n=1 Tax=Streptomyces pristinaespiralis TaxID=38300 RepID=UPI0037BD6A65
MSAFITPDLRRRLKSRKTAVAGIAAVAATTVALSLAPSGEAEAGVQTEAAAAAPVAWKADSKQVAAVHESITSQKSAFEAQLKATQAKAKAEAKAEKAAAEKKAAAKAAAEKRAKEQAASRSAARPAKVTYPNNLDGWIREAMAIMKKHDIPGSYEGIHRNIMRESSGNPRAINNWDINAINGVPSKGLLQVIKPTFDAYHIPGTSWDQYDPVANIVAACNYAADRYGSMDNVNSAY